MVSRNGHSWKTIKPDPNSSSRIWSGTKNAQSRHFEEKKYFKDLEEAVYIRIYPEVWGGGGIGLRVGLIAL